MLQLLATGASQDSTEQLKDSLTPLVAGLRRTGRLGVVQASFRDAVAQRTKALVRWACAPERPKARLGMLNWTHWAKCTAHLKRLWCREAVERAVPVVLSADKRSSLVSLQDRLQVSVSPASTIQDTLARKFPAHTCPWRRMSSLRLVQGRLETAYSVGSERGRLPEDPGSSTHCQRSLPGPCCQHQSCCVGHLGCRQSTHSAAG